MAEQVNLTIEGESSAKTVVIRQEVVQGEMYPQTIEYKDINVYSVDEEGKFNSGPLTPLPDRSSQVDSSLIAETLDTGITQDEIDTTFKVLGRVFEVIGARQ